MDINLNIANDVLTAIRAITSKTSLSLSEPVFQGKEAFYLNECIESTFVSSVGKFVDEFERKLEEYTGAKHAISLVNGTSALHIALKVLGISSDDEVLVPALSFIASANAVAYCNGTSHFIDSEEDTLGVDVDKLAEYLKFSTEQRSGFCINKKTNKAIKAIIPVHTFGHPVRIDSLIDLANKHNIKVIEDAAESIGSFYKGQHTGTFGLMGTLSFNGNKTITTGGGGALLTNDTSLAKLVKHLTTTAKKTHRWEFIHDEIGFNYRMPNINAALGCGQLECISQKIQSKRKLFERYRSEFNSLTDLILFNEPVNCKSNFWLQTIILKKDNIQLRDKILQVTNDASISTRPAWQTINSQKSFQNCPSMDLSCAESLYKRIINIPSSPNI
jgi:aminotransferase in exopolysaccharide biosynthesis